MLYYNTKTKEFETLKKTSVDYKIPIIKEDLFKYNMGEQNGFNFSVLRGEIFRWTNDRIYHPYAQNKYEVLTF